ncbi:hypothetical protein HZA96_04405 [Candidatus Woesearchaeota archaeon]|nr:hypothetical protein [Candidatus Woesearchaeota archaeon]
MITQNPAQLLQKETLIYEINALDSIIDLSDAEKNEWFEKPFTLPKISNIYI